MTINNASGSALSSLTLTSTEQANVLGSLVLGASVTTLAINASTSLQFGGITTSALRTVTVSGTAATVSLDRIGSALTSFDASGLSAGNVAIILGASPTMNFVGSAGNDMVQIDAGSLMTGFVNGAGASDVLAMYTGLSLTAATGPRFTNFEVLRVASTNSSEGQTFDTSFLSGFQTYQIASGTPRFSLNLNKLANDTSVVFLGTISNASLGMNDASGSTDSLNVTLGNNVSNTDALTNGITVTLRAAGVETIKLHSVGIAGGMELNILNIDAGTNSTLSKVVIDGTQSIRLQSLASVLALTVDASLLTGALEV